VELPFDTAPPSAVAQEVIDALTTGTEDVYPDAVAKMLYQGWKADAKALEQQMAQSVVTAEA
jgi:hypothetical protein